MFLDNACLTRVLFSFVSEFWNLPRCLQEESFNSRNLIALEEAQCRRLANSTEVHVSILVATVAVADGSGVTGCTTVQFNC